MTPSITIDSSGWLEIAKKPANQSFFFSQSEVFEFFLNCSDWLDKSRPSKKDTFVLII